MLGKRRPLPVAERARIPIPGHGLEFRRIPRHPVGGETAVVETYATASQTMRFNIGSNKIVEIVSVSDPLADSFDKPLKPAELEWHVRGCARDGSGLWQLRSLVEQSGARAGNLSDAQVVEEAVRQARSGWLVGQLADAPRIDTYGLFLKGGEAAAYASPGTMPVGPPPRLTNKCNLAAYCEEQFRIAAKEGIARVDCPVLNGGQCPT